MIQPNDYQRPPWPAAVAALLAYVVLGISSGAVLPLAILGLGLTASYLFSARFENVTLTKWTLRIIAVGLAVFGYLLTAVKDDNAYFDVRYLYSFALAASAEIALQFWRREPTGGPRAPFTVFLSAMVFLTGCGLPDDGTHLLWYLAPAFFLFFALALPGFRTRTTVPMRLALLPILLALLLGGITHLGFARYKDALNALGSGNYPTRRVSASMGMSGQPILGSSFTLRDSLTRVLRVQNMGSDPYLRGMTFDTYSGRTWAPALEQRTFLTYRPAAAVHGPSARFIRLDDTDGLLFMPLHSAAIVPEGLHPLEWATRTDGPLRTPSTDTDSLIYDVTEGPLGLMAAPPTGSERVRDLAIPSEIDPRILTIAQKVGSKGMGAAAKIEAVVRFLQTNNRYSLTVNPGSGDPISNFILERKAAHCEYFASAAVILLRAVGVPTRYVSGYFAYESDGKNQILVRQRDAHAWAESWVEGKGWVTVDATPGDGRPDALAGAIPWYWSVWEVLQDALGAVRQWLVSADWLEKGSVFALLVLGLLVPQVYRWWQRRRLAGLGFHYSSPDAALTLIAERFEALLARRGLPCPPERTWPDHLRQIEHENDTALETFVRDYGHARFGTLRPQEEIARLDAELRVLEKQR
jgi:transglutaminase-like putative cysteine protease